MFSCRAVVASRGWQWGEVFMRDQPWLSALAEAQIKGIAARKGRIKVLAVQLGLVLTM